MYLTIGLVALGGVTLYGAVTYPKSKDKPSAKEDKPPKENDTLLDGLEPTDVVAPMENIEPQKTEIRPGDLWSSKYNVGFRPSPKVVVIGVGEEIITYAEASTVFEACQKREPISYSPEEFRRRYMLRTRAAKDFVQPVLENQIWRNKYEPGMFLRVTRISPSGTIYTTCPSFNKGALTNHWEAALFRETPLTERWNFIRMARHDEKPPVSPEPEKAPESPKRLPKVGEVWKSKATSNLCRITSVSKSTVGTTFFSINKKDLALSEWEKHKQVGFLEIFEYECDYEPEEEKKSHTIILPGQIWVNKQGLYVRTCRAYDRNSLVNFTSPVSTIEAALVKSTDATRSGSFTKFFQEYTFVQEPAPVEVNQLRRWNGSNMYFFITDDAGVNEVVITNAEADPYDIDLQSRNNYFRFNVKSNSVVVLDNCTKLPQVGEVWKWKKDDEYFRIKTTGEKITRSASFNADKVLQDFLTGKSECISGLVYLMENSLFFASDAEKAKKALANGSGVAVAVEEKEDRQLAVGQIWNVNGYLTEILPKNKNGFFARTKMVDKGKLSSTVLVCTTGMKAAPASWVLETDSGKRIPAVGEVWYDPFERRWQVCKKNDAGEYILHQIGGAHVVFLKNLSSGWRRVPENNRVVSGQIWKKPRGEYTQILAVNGDKITRTHGKPSIKEIDLLNVLHWSDSVEDVLQNPRWTLVKDVHLDVTNDEEVEEPKVEEATTRLKPKVGEIWRSPMWGYAQITGFTDAGEVIRTYGTMNLKHQKPDNTKVDTQFFNPVEGWTFYEVSVEIATQFVVTDIWKPKAGVLPLNHGLFGRCVQIRKVFKDRVVFDVEGKDLTHKLTREEMLLQFEKVEKPRVGERYRTIYAPELVVASVTPTKIVMADPDDKNAKTNFKTNDWQNYLSII